MQTQTKITILTALMMSFAMSIFFSGVFTLLAIGPGVAWLLAWARGFAMGWPLGFALAMLIGLPVRALAIRLSGVFSQER